MKITVIIPTCSPKDYIFECLTALKNQSLPREDFEVLVVLNGEKESYYTQINNYVKIKNLINFKLVYTEMKGVSNARNIGLDLAKGEYIAFIDDDDYIDENYLEVMLKTVENKEKAICCTNYKHFNEKTFEELECTNYLWGDETTKLEKYRKVFSSIGAKLIPTSVIENIRFNNKLKNSEDALFMSLISKNIREVCVANKKTYYNRRVRTSSANMNKKSLKEILYVFVFLTKIHIKLLFQHDYKKKFILLRFFAIIKGMIYQLRNKLM